MSSIGWGALPISVSLRGLQKQINTELKAPLEKAAKSAGSTLEKGVGSGVDAAASKVEKANFRVKKSSEELADAESKLSAEKLKSEAAAKQLEAAEAKLADIKKSGKATAEQLAKAEADVLAKRGRAEAAAHNVEKAERGVEKALTESARASESLTKAQKDLEAATDGSANSTKGFISAADGAEGATGRFEASLAKAALAATAIVGAIGAAGKAAYDLGFSFDAAYDTIRIGTGASGAAFEDLQQSMRNVAQDSIRVGDDIGEIGSTLADLNTRLGVTGEPLEQLTTQFLQLKNMGMDTDVNAVTGAFRQFGVEVDAMPGMMDTLFQISQATGRGMNELVNNLTKSGPALQEFGFDLTESAGLLGALDKAGLDADKTMQSMTKALSEFAKNGEDPQQALWGMIQQIDGLVGAGKSAEAVDLANSIFGARGGTGFVAAVQSGAFAYEDFMDSLGASEDTIGGLAEETASFAEKWDNLKLRLMLAFEPIATAFFDAIVPAFNIVWAAVQPIFNLLTTLVAVVRRALDALAPVFASVVDAGRETWDKFATFISDIWDKTVGRIGQGIDEVREFFSGFTPENSGMVAFLVDVRDTVADIGRTIGDNLGTVFGALATLGQSAGGALFNVLKGVFSLLQGLWKILSPVLSVLAKVVGGVLMGAFMGILKVVQLVSHVMAGLATAISWLVEHAVAPAITFFGKLAGEILSRVVPVITFVSGLFVNVLGGAFKLLGAVVSFAWNGVIKPVFDAFGAVANWLWANVLMPVFDNVKAGFSDLATKLNDPYQSIIKPMLDAFGAAGTWLYENAIKPAFDGIKSAFQLMADGMRVIYDNVLKPVFDLLVWVAQTAWDGVGVIFGLIRTAFEAVGSGMRWVYDNVIKPVWDAFGNSLRWLYDNVVLPVAGWIGDRWSEMGTALDVTKSFIVDTVFGGLKTGLDKVQGWFETAVDSISRIWDGVKRATARPVRFVVETVFNNGIKKAWNAVANFTGLKKLDAINLGDLGQYARGGVLPGYTPGRDPYTFVEPRTGMRIGLSGGEAILRPEATRALGADWVDNINRAARQGGQAGVKQTLLRSHFANGGIIDLGNFASGGFTNLAGGLSAIQQSMGGFVGRFFPGKFNLTSATRKGDPGYHGRGMATDWQAKDGHFQTQMPTRDSKALARAIYKNFRNSTELIHWPLDGWTNLKNGQHLDYGAGTNAGHQNHIHWAITSPLRFNGEEITLDTVPGEGGGGWNPLSIVKGIWDGIVGKIGKFAEAASHGLIGQLPGALAKKLLDSAWNFVRGKSQEEGAYHGEVGGGVEQWRSMVVAVLRDKGFSENLADTVLRRMNQESGGNPRALNDWDINAKNGTPSKGLMQGHRSDFPGE